MYSVGSILSQIKQKSSKETLESLLKVITPSLSSLAGARIGASVGSELFGKTGSLIGMGIGSFIGLKTGERIEEEVKKSLSGVEWIWQSDREFKLKKALKLFGVEDVSNVSIQEINTKYDVYITISPRFSWWRQPRKIYRVNEIF